MCRQTMSSLLQLQLLGLNVTYVSESEEVKPDGRLVRYFSSDLLLMAVHSGQQLSCYHVNTYPVRYHVNTHPARTMLYMTMQAAGTRHCHWWRSLFGCRWVGSQPVQKEHRHYQGVHDQTSVLAVHAWCLAAKTACCCLSGEISNTQ